MAQSILQNVITARKNGEITNHSSKIPLLPTGSGKIFFFWYAALDEVNGTLERVHIPSAKSPERVFFHFMIAFHAKDVREISEALANIKSAINSKKIEESKMTNSCSTQLLKQSSGTFSKTRKGVKRWFPVARLKRGTAQKEKINCHPP